MDISVHEDCDEDDVHKRKSKSKSAKMDNSVHEDCDEDNVRKQRRIKKRELTKKLSKLKTILQVISDNQVQSSEVKEEVVTDLFERMKYLLKSVVNLHHRVQLLREPDPDGAKEDGLLDHRCKKGWNAGTMFPEII
jgi:hypothetical protein